MADLSEIALYIAQKPQVSVRSQASKAVAYNANDIGLIVQYGEDEIVLK